MAKPFEVAMIALAEFLGLPLLHLPFRLRLDLLLYRCRLIALEERVKLLTPLQAIADGSSHTKILINGLEQLTVSKAHESAMEMASKLRECQAKGLKRLEVEWRLVQAGFIVIPQHLGATPFTEELSVHRREVLLLCQSFPSTAGLLKPSHDNLSRFLLGQRHSGHNIYTRSTRNVWWTFPKHEVGNLKQCARGHPYSGSIWPHCGECGPEVQRSADDSADETMLNKEDFEVAMRNFSFDGASYR